MHAYTCHPSKADASLSTITSIVIIYTVYLHRTMGSVKGVEYFNGSIASDHAVDATDTAPASTTPTITITLALAASKASPTEALMPKKRGRPKTV
jgi:hypothetical protein